MLEKVVSEQAQHNCFYCGRQEHLIREKHNEALPFLHIAKEEVTRDAIAEQQIKQPNETFLSLHSETKKEQNNAAKGLNVGQLTTEQYKQLSELFEEFRDIFAWSPEQLGRTDRVHHPIDVGDAKPIRQRWYRTSRPERAYIEEELQRMLQQGIIEKSRSSWASLVVLVKKKNGKLRFCVDYRQLNAVTKKDSYPIPRIDDMLDSLGNSAWFSSLDLASGYWQVEMHPDDKEKTAFITQFGTYQFLVMPFGLCNAPATFQQLMNDVFKEILWDFVVVYLNDLNVHSKTFDQHIDHLRSVFGRLREAGLKLNPEKCFFGKQELSFLGYVIGKNGIHTDPSKIEKVQNFPVPRTLTQLRGFLGLASYYRRFIKGFSTIANPLNKLLKKNIPYNWTEAQQAAFDHLKQCLVTAPILIYPDFEEEFLLYTDASTFGLGAILAQVDKEGNDRVVVYASRTLSAPEKNYSATELEY